MSGLELRFLAKLGASWEKATPGFKVQAFHKRKKIVDLEIGETARYYDWASLTKVVFTTTRLMMLMDEKRYRLTDPVHKWVPWFPEPGAGSLAQAPSTNARLRELLSHSAGMTWWYPFYKSLMKKSVPNGKFVLSPEEAWVQFEGLLKRRVLNDLKKQALSKIKTPLKETKAVYSDLDFFLLGSALQNMTDLSLDENWQIVRKRSGLSQTDFSRGNQPSRQIQVYAPTESCAIRGVTMRGAVHDENAWALGGVAPHSGLFGPIEDLSHWALQIRDLKLLRESKKSFVSKKTLELFSTRSVAKARGDWALGFMMPTKGSASCGPLFSAQSIGHTGFTGTSVWFDPKQDLLVVILSNRVHPTRENRAFVTLRPQLHTWIAEQL